jgi:hypothetical protein
MADEGPLEFVAVVTYGTPNLSLNADATRQRFAPDRRAPIFGSHRIVLTMLPEF